MKSPGNPNLKSELADFVATCLKALLEAEEGGYSEWSVEDSWWIVSNPTGANLLMFGNQRQPAIFAVHAHNTLLPQALDLLMEALRQLEQSEVDISECRRAAVEDHLRLIQELDEKDAELAKLRGETEH